MINIKSYSEKNKLIFLICVLLFSFNIAFSPDISSCQDLNSVGIYNLTQDVSSVGANCFTIDSVDVTLNCNGYSISGDWSYRGIQIFGLADRSNITVQNCNILNYSWAMQFTQDVIDSKFENINISDSFRGIISGSTVINSSFNNININNINGTSGAVGYGVGIHIPILLRTNFTNLVVDEVADNSIYIGTTQDSLFSNFLLKNFKDYGFDLNTVNDKTNMTIENGVIEFNNGDYGFYGRSIKESIFRNLTFNGTSAGAGIYFHDNSNYGNYENQYLNNYFYNISFGIQLQGINYNNIFSGNNFESTISISDTINGDLNNSIFTNNQINGFTMFSFNGNNHTNNLIYDNTFRNLSTITILNSPDNSFNFSGIGKIGRASCRERVYAPV